MQLWHGREGERLTLGQTGLASDFVAVRGWKGEVEILFPEPELGETVADALAEARRRMAVCHRKDNQSRLTGGGDLA